MSFPLGGEVEGEYHYPTQNKIMSDNTKGQLQSQVPVQSGATSNNTDFFLPGIDDARSIKVVLNKANSQRTDWYPYTGSWGCFPRRIIFLFDHDS